MSDWVAAGIGLAIGACGFFFLLAAARDRGLPHRRGERWAGLWPSLACVGLLAGLAAVWNMPGARRMLTRGELNALSMGLVTGGVGMLLAYAVYRLSTLWDRRRATERIVIGQIAAVVRQNLPLATATALAADSEQGSERAILRRISALVAQGLPLSEAIRLGYPNCSGLALSLVVAGEKAAQLPDALDQAEAILTDDHHWSEGQEGGMWLYLCVVFATTMLIVAGLMVAVVPKFQEIFKDFGVQLPKVTQWLIAISRGFADYTLAGMLVLVPMLIAVPAAFYLSLRPRRAESPFWTSRVGDWFRWHTPGLCRIERGRAMARVLQTMRIGLRSGMTLDQAAWLATDVDVNCQLRPRIGRFAEFMRDGAKPAQAAERAGLGGIVPLALSAGQRSQNMDAALRYAVDYHDALSSRAWVVLRNLAWPLMTLALASLVAFVVVALFTPLVALINACTF